MRRLYETTTIQLSTIGRAMLTRLAAISATLLALASIVAQAQDDHWYTIEIIVFEYVDAPNPDEETWPRDPGTPSLKNAVELISESELALEFEFAEASTTAVSSAPHAFRLLSDTEFGLRKVFDSLKRSRNYRPIVHLAWRQPGYDKAHARPAHLLVPFKQPEDAPVPTIDREPNSKARYGSTASVTCMSKRTCFTTSPASPAPSRYAGYQVPRWSSKN